MVKKSKGNILLELVAGLFILSIIGLLAFNLAISANKYLQNEKEERETYECFHAVVNEIRYNLDKEKFKSKAVSNKVKIPHITKSIYEFSRRAICTCTCKPVNS
mgnify:CR=1 FL=1